MCDHVHAFRIWNIRVRPLPCSCTLKMRWPTYTCVRRIFSPTSHWPHSNCRTVRHPKSHFPVVDAGRLRTEHMDMTISILPLDFPFIHIVGSIGHIRWPTKLSGEHIIFVLFVQRDAASVCERSQFCIYVYSEELLLSCRGLKEWVECFWRRQWRRWPLKIILIYALQNNWVHEYLCVCAMLDFCSSIR